MALRAGYKGFKKLINGLKVLRPGVLGIDIGTGLAIGQDGKLNVTGVEVTVAGNPEEAATAGDLTKLQIGDDIFNVPDTTYSDASTTEAGLMSADDKIKLNGLDKNDYFLRSEQAILGAKNINKSESEFTFVKSSARTHRFTLSIPIKNGESYRVTATLSDVADFTNDTALGIRIGADAQSNEVSISKTATAINIVLTATVDAETTGLYVYIPSNEASTATCKLSNVMVTLASDPDDTYVPFAMTNRELTEKNLNKGLLTSADDLDDIKTTGWYTVSTSPAHSPESQTYYTLFVDEYGNVVRQLIFRGDAIYTRRYGGSPAAWTNWVKYTGTTLT